MIPRKAPRRFMFAAASDHTSLYPLSRIRCISNGKWRKGDGSISRLLLTSDNMAQRTNARGFRVLYVTKPLCEITGKDVESRITNKIESSTFSTYQSDSGCHSRARHSVD